MERRDYYIFETSTSKEVWKTSKVLWDTTNWTSVLDKMKFLKRLNITNNSR